MNTSMAWANVRACETLAGVWVALDNCRYDQATHQPIEGDVVDSDEDLAELCGRLRETGRSSCVIYFCENEPLVETRSAAGYTAVQRLNLVRYT
jgi:hypothetical protein